MVTNSNQPNINVPTFHKDPSIPQTPTEAAKLGSQNAERQNELVNTGASKGGKRRSNLFRKSKKIIKRSKSKKSRRILKGKGRNYGTSRMMIGCNKCSHKRRCSTHIMKGGVPPPPPGKMLAPEGPTASYPGANATNNQSHDAIQSNVNAQRAAEGDKVTLVQPSNVQKGGRKKTHKRNCKYHRK